MENDVKDFLICLLDEHYTLWKAPLEMWPCIQALGVKPLKDGNQWSFLYGENLQEGIAGFGDTVYEAACNFYKQIIEEKIVK